MRIIRTNGQTLFAKVCLAVIEYDRITRDGGASGSWSEFLQNAKQDPSEMCYEIADIFNDLFPDYEEIDENEGNAIDLCFELGQLWFKFVSDEVGL